MQKTISKQVKFKDGFGKIHAISTGTVSVKRKFKYAKGGSTLSKMNFIMDREYTDPLPIWVWVIEHPEGTFLIDTGENSNVNDKGYFKKEGLVANWINTTQFRFEVERSEEIGVQLSGLNISPDKIDTVVLTHLHLDHIDGLKYFEYSKILVNAKEWKHPSFALPSLFPKWLSPTLVRLTSEQFGCFSKGLPLTKAKDLFLVATPGHTKGHSSVLATPEGPSYLFAGDVTYDQQQLINETYAGAHQDFSSSKSTYHAIKKYAAQNRMVYLPSHDWQSAGRLECDIFLDTVSNKPQN